MKRADIENIIWERTKQEMKSIIIEYAKRAAMITYSELLNKEISLKLNMEQIDHRNIMAQLLGEISQEEDKAGRGMLSAIVIHKNGSMEPGQGFFNYAQLLGKDISNPIQFWVREVQKVHNYWCNSR